MKTHTLRRAISIALFAATTGTSSLVLAQSSDDHEAAGLCEAEVAKQFEIAPGALDAALGALAARSDRRIVYPQSLVANGKVPAVQGRMLWRDAVATLLQGSGFDYREVGDGTMVIESAHVSPDRQVAPESDATPAPQGANAIELEAVTVTGTRIRGGTTPSPVITLGSERIREEGFADLGEVIRSVPQNFSGGQNPGVTGVSGSAGSQDLTGGSSLNLRGLGADASLTLLNGRRLAYDGFSQAVDISAIPVEAVGRLEIVPDGASAVYGSDAVGGVANVILARDFEGLAVGARYGGATGGGLATREWSATTGTTWASGGLIATFKDTSTDPIFAHQRDFTDHLRRPYTIYNGWDSRNALLSLHQSLGEVAEFRMDTLRTEREAEKDITQPATHQRYATEATVSLVAPSIELFLPRDWSLTGGGTLGKNSVDEVRQLVVGDSANLLSHTGIANRSRSFELGAEGRLFDAGGGAARLAFGVGTRTDEFEQLNRINDASFGGHERARHAYAELNLPLVAPASGIKAVRRFEMSAAFRSEDYASFGRVTTPKFGVIYDPVEALTLKASWGKSFKAPTLNQRYLNKTAYLWSAAATGGSGYPAGSTVLMSYGGNQDLRAERATTWTASLALHPAAWPGFEAELTTFHVDYTDRVVEPINYRLALSNPSYAEFVDYAPTPAQQAELLAIYNTFYNLAGVAYDPSNVVAIIRDQFVNAAQQRIKGVDLTGAYGFDVGAGRLTLRGAASWIESTQRNSAGQPEYALAGTVFNPARVNSRVGSVWAAGGLTASAFVNYTSGVTNQLASVREKTASFTTLDLNLTYDTSRRAGLLSGTTFGLSAVNLLDRDPPLYTPRDANFVPYDATNYSAMGRFVSASVTKRW